MGRGRPSGCGRVGGRSSPHRGSRRRGARARASRKLEPHGTIFLLPGVSGGRTVSGAPRPALRWSGAGRLGEPPFLGPPGGRSSTSRSSGQLLGSSRADPPLNRSPCNTPTTALEFPSPHQDSDTAANLHPGVARRRRGGAKVQTVVAIPTLRRPRRGPRSSSTAERRRATSIPPSVRPPLQGRGRVPGPLLTAGRPPFFGPYVATERPKTAAPSRRRTSANQRLRPLPESRTPPLLSAPG